MIDNLANGFGWAIGNCLETAWTKKQFSIPFSAIFAPSRVQVGFPSQSARGLAQSKTLREFTAGSSGRQLLGCASPLALSDDDVSGWHCQDRQTERDSIRLVLVLDSEREFRGRGRGTKDEDEKDAG